MAGKRTQDDTQSAAGGSMISTSAMKLQRREPCGDGGRTLIIDTDCRTVPGSRSW